MFNSRLRLSFQTSIYFFDLLFPETFAKVSGAFIAWSHLWKQFIESVALIKHWCILRMIPKTTTEGKFSAVFQLKKKHLQEYNESRWTVCFSFNLKRNYLPTYIFKQLVSSHCTEQKERQMVSSFKLVNFNYLLVSKENNHFNFVRLNDFTSFVITHYSLISGKQTSSAGTEINNNCFLLINKEKGR